MPDLFDTFDLKGLMLPNRIVMSAMTRTRATEDDVPTEMMRDYYMQRASAGLIITECTQISNQAHGIIRAPGLHRGDQIVAMASTGSTAPRQNRIHRSLSGALS